MQTTEVAKGVAAGLARGLGHGLARGPAQGPAKGLAEGLAKGWPSRPLSSVSMAPEGEERTVRSYARRRGRVTRAQRRALEAHWDRYGVDPDGPLELDALFGRAAPRVLEIGFGMGGALLAMATEYPGADFLGIEVYEAGVGRLLAGAAAAGIDNLRVVRDDAVDVLRDRIPPASLDAVLLYFPDPWPKKRHHKRRLVKADFAAMVAERLAPAGRFELATDWEPYAMQMLETLDATPGLRNARGPGAFAPRPGYRPRTKFETRGERMGHQVWDLAYVRDDDR